MADKISPVKAVTMGNCASPLVTTPLSPPACLDWPSPPVFTRSLLPVCRTRSIAGNSAHECPCGLLGTRFPGQLPAPRPRSGEQSSFPGAGWAPPRTAPGGTFGWREFWLFHASACPEHGVHSALCTLEEPTEGQGVLRTRPPSGGSKRTQSDGSTGV